MMALVGNDVVALFPCIMAEKTNRIVRDEIMLSEIKIEGKDLERAKAFIERNKNNLKDIEGIEHTLPKRI